MTYRPESDAARATMHIDKVFVGAMVLRHLRDRADDPDQPAIKTLIRTYLIERRSVRQRESGLQAHS